MAGSFRSFLLILVLLARLSAAAGVRVQGFSFNGVSNRFITPNNDGRNDNVAFSYSNPFDSAGTVKIFDLRGHLLTTIPINAGGLDTCPSATPGCPVWDGRANGQVVPTGVYIFVIAVESVVASGAVVVIR
ncbi:MAG TPA: gliding motility-associated C-terminal domain-containing protein [Elusimicrobiota bacterium]|jgi:gliding motility-associated-like protein|nr:gliding motility-associated C-terminal domain-containing protein [Elusimicrobiota bacterium]